MMINGLKKPHCINFAPVTVVLLVLNIVSMVLCAIGCLVLVLLLLIVFSFLYILIVMFLLPLLVFK